MCHANYYPLPSRYKVYNNEGVDVNIYNIECFKMVKCNLNRCACFTYV